MAVTSNTTTTAQITIKAKEIDLANRFTATWEALTEIMGVMRPIRKSPGTKLVSSKASITLELPRATRFLCPWQRSSLWHSRTWP